MLETVITIILAPFALLALVAVGAIFVGIIKSIKKN